MRLGLVFTAAVVAVNTRNRGSRGKQKAYAGENNAGLNGLSDGQEGPALALLDGDFPVTMAWTSGSACKHYATAMAALNPDLCNGPVINKRRNTAVYSSHAERCLDSPNCDARFRCYADRSQPGFKGCPVEVLNTFFRTRNLWEMWCPPETTAILIPGRRRIATVQCMNEKMYRAYIEKQQNYADIQQASSSSAVEYRIADNVENEDPEMVEDEANAHEIMIARMLSYATATQFNCYDVIAAAGPSKHP